MKITTKRSGEEMCVVAITWPHKKYQNKTLESIETQFSAFDGVALQDFTYD